MGHPSYGHEPDAPERDAFEPTAPPHTVAIVGAGFSGTVTALNLLETSQGNVRVLLIEAAPEHGPGLAYATLDDNLVLNVPAQNMSAFADRTDDFLDYCRTQDATWGPASFVPRRIYGQYLQHLIGRAQRAHGGALMLVKQKVIGLHKADHGYVLQCASGDSLDAHAVVLALGHFPPQPLRKLLGHRIDARALIVDDPSSGQALGALPEDKDVLIVGAGHTAIDTAFKLQSAAPLRRIFMLSRHGLHPQGHRARKEFQKIPDLQAEVEQAVLDCLEGTPSIRRLMHVVRNIIAHTHADWRDVIYSLRPLTPTIWQKLPVHERARFLRHVLPFWDVARHRLAPMAFKRLMNSVEQERVKMGGYALQDIRVQEDGSIEVRVRRRHGDAVTSFKIGAVVNCSGPTYDLCATGDPLMLFLVAQGVIQQDELKIGLRVAADYTVHPQYPRLHYVGPMLKAAYWEAIAVPELRVHAAKLAQTILNEFQRVATC